MDSSTDVISAPFSLGDADDILGDLDRIIPSSPDPVITNETVEDTITIPLSPGDAAEILDHLNRALTPSPEPVLINGNAEEHHPCPCKPLERVRQASTSAPSSLKPIEGALQYRNRPVSLLATHPAHARLQRILGIRIPRGRFVPSPQLLGRLPPAKRAEAGRLNRTHNAHLTPPVGSESGQSEDEPHHPSADFNSRQELTVGQSEDEPRHPTSHLSLLSSLPELASGQSEDEPHHPPVSSLTQEESTVGPSEDEPRHPNGLSSSVAPKPPLKLPETEPRCLASSLPLFPLPRKSGDGQSGGDSCHPPVFPPPT